MCTPQAFVNDSEELLEISKRSGPPGQCFPTFFSPVRCSLITFSEFPQCVNRSLLTEGVVSIMRVPGTGSVRVL